ncbi:Cof-type HAD-IIB family hydrolase [Lutibacter sp. TH_r2]|uniref:Cof-type HAD-IIB family hydrolase n=1 Tax=Lutibacter sp. TH_r2 TaxID=3082083 RepID=UPI002955D953|nr:Cof-type HAD-IIB family hydrolase [Lutibacter sp. TH_r2]MDV7186397.1 Cof-type HAD-IIB family hydrolase [Lutibacter sp. TH_r2]
MKYQLVCSDIDGTLLNKDRELAKATIEQVQRIAPIPFILISSRMPKAMRHLQTEFGNTSTPLIAYNGGLVLDNEKVLHSTEIDNTVLAETIKKCEETSIHLSLYHADEWYVPSMDYWAKREENNTKVTPEVLSNIEVLEKWKNEGKGAHKIMCMGDENEIDTLYKSLEIEFSDEIMLYRSKETYIEISHKSISKKTAINTLIDVNYPHLTMENVVAFGDNYNDVEMLKAVGLGVAVGNAKVEVLEVANSVTDTNKNDGVAKAIKEYFQ